jgi:hypothetical protein
MKNFTRFILLAVIFLTAVNANSAVKFKITFDAKISENPVSGKLYVLLDDALYSRPYRRNVVNPYRPQPAYRLDVNNWKPEEAIILDQSATYAVFNLDNLPVKRYVIQAVLDTNPLGRTYINEAGNGYSKIRIEKINVKKDQIFEIHIDQVTKSREFVEDKFVKKVCINSKLLSDFYAKSIPLEAGIILPESYYSNPEAKYPVLYVIPGFTGYHYDTRHNARRYAKNKEGIDRILVVLEPNCSTGHHVFADSENNGPRATALVKELIPYIEKNYRVLAESQARLLVGQSSGAWAALWLQIKFPDIFGGAWVTAPDPVDFRSFLDGANIYKPGENLFFDAQGKARRFLLREGFTLVTVKEFSDMEKVVGEGEQLGSFEAVFSRRGTDGKPEKLYDRKTGKINQKVAKDWKKYDIRIQLERNWDTLGPKLKGKLHIYVGNQDDAMLDQAVRLLDKSLKNLGSDAVIEFHDDDHGIVDNRELRKRINEDIDETLNPDHPEGTVLYNLTF